MKDTAAKKEGGQGAFWLELGLTLGALVGIVAGRRLAEPLPMNRAGLWQRLLAERLGDMDAAMLMARVQAQYDELFARRPRFAHRALRMHLERYILPGLALYHVLREVHSDRQTALAEWDVLVGSPEGSQTRKLLSWLRYMPAPFAIFRAAVRWRMRREFPPAGWNIEWVAADNHRLAFNIHRCFYLNVLTAYGAPELTEHFCRLDDLAFATLPPSIIWTRATTLGRGGALCDFCWSRVAPNAQGVST